VIVALKDATTCVKKELIEVGRNQAKAPACVSEHFASNEHRSSAVTSRFRWFAELLGEAEAVAWKDQPVVEGADGQLQVVAPIGADGGIAALRNRCADALPQASVGREGFCSLRIQLPLSELPLAGVAAPMGHRLATCPP